MSYSTWHNYGFGLHVDLLTGVTVEKLHALLHLIPELEKQMEATAWELEYDDLDAYLRCSLENGAADTIASMLQETVLAAEGIELSVCKNYEDECYLIYQPNYPWQMNEHDLALTEESLENIFRKYVGVLTDDEILLEFQEVENGG